MNPTPEPLIDAQDLSRLFGAGEAAIRAVDGVSLQVMRGETLLIFGPSGSGKSTLLRILGGLDRGYQGRLELFGEAIDRLKEHRLAQLRGQRIGFVFQEFHLIDHLNVLDNLLTPTHFLATRRELRAARARAGALLEQVGLSERASALPSELSGGQRQRVAIARALLNEPELVLCDEPTGNLDQTTGTAIIELFGELQAQLGTALVIVTHEERMSQLPHRRLDMCDGGLAGMVSSEPRAASASPAGTAR